MAKPEGRGSARAQAARAAAEARRAEPRKVKIEIHRIYEDDDPEFVGDALQVQLWVNDNKVLSGDWYHDKIDERIEGYLAGLRFMGAEFEEPTVIRVADEQRAYGF